MSASDKWLFDLLTEGVLPGDVNEEGRTPTRTLCAVYGASLKSRGRSWDASASGLGRFLKKRLGELLTNPRAREEGTRVRYYQFAPLAECRTRFAERLAITPDWPSGSTWHKEEHAAPWV